MNCDIDLDTEQEQKNIYESSSSFKTIKEGFIG